MTHLPKYPFPPRRDPGTSAREPASAPGCNPHHNPQHNPWAAPPPRALWRRALAWCGAALERRRSRRLLARLDARQLHDIGISRSEAAVEAQKPFWRP